MNKILGRLSEKYIDSSKKAAGLIDRVKMTEHLFMIILSIIIGILGGFGAVGIRALIEFINELAFSGDGTLLDNMIATPWYWKIIIPAIGGLIVGPIIYFFAPEAKGHGVPEVMQSIILKGGVIRPRVAFVKAFASAVTIGTGGSVGREGPIIQIGSSLGSTVGQFFRVSSKRMKTLVACGAAAGIAAAFNAPVAGALFAVELILMDYGVKHFTPIVIASVLATVISHLFEGDFAAFSVPVFVLKSPWEISFYFVLGILSGIVSYIFIKVLYFFEDFWDDKIAIPPYLKAGVGGIIIGILAIQFPQILGIGYDSISAALNSSMFWGFALALIFLKIFATSITLGSGGSGGIFAPSLFMGAMLGAFFGTGVHHFFPEISAQPGAYAVVAMGGLVAGTTRAPLTAIIIVFELTKENAIFLPLMIVCTISTILSAKLSRESIYTLKLLNRNIKIKEKAEVNIMKSILVNDIYSTKFATIREDANFTEVIHILLHEKLPFISVLDLSGNLMGIISLHDIKDLILHMDDLQYVLIAGDIADKNIIKTTPDENCRKALAKMSKSDYDGIPVVDPQNQLLQIGIIWRKDIDNAYEHEIDKIELTTDLADKIKLGKSDMTDITFIEGYSITEIPVPNQFIGHTIMQLNIRAKYGIDVLSIKNISDSGQKVKAIPASNYKFQEGDHIIVAGEIKNIEILKDL